MRRIIQLVMLVEGTSYAIAGSIHFGVLIDGYQHRQAAIAESTIATILLAGCVLTWLWRTQTRSIGLAAQGFALLVTLIGAFTIAIGVGPRTVPDIIYHVAILAVLIAGLALAIGAPAADTGQ